ncbi:MAG: hypothetical protein Aureis2KO_18070 [Aureisphaera sp.]
MKRLLVTYFILQAVFCFAQEGTRRSDIEAYGVINTALGTKNIAVYKYFSNSKGWSVILSSEDIFDSLLGHCLNANGTETLEYSEVINEKEAEAISYELQSFRPNEKLKKDLLSRNIKIRGNSKAQALVRVTKPIFFSDKAVLFMQYDLEEKVLIFQKDVKGGWNLLCEKFLYLSTKN